jgi:hypothetical protein
MNGIILIQADRGQEFVIKNANIHNNTVIQTNGIVAGAVVNSAYSHTFSDFHNRFSQNTYVIDGYNPKPFQWMNNLYTLAEWQHDLGND